LPLLLLLSFAAVVDVVFAVVAATDANRSAAAFADADANANAALPRCNISLLGCAAPVGAGRLNLAAKRAAAVSCVAVVVAVVAPVAVDAVDAVAPVAVDDALVPAATGAAIDAVASR
jgi:hypothetical protein